MNIILLQGHLSLQEIEQLLKEFPQFLFLSLTETTYKNLTPAHWSRVEILYGSRLSEEELELAPQLRWIHSPLPLLNRLCMDAIEERGNVLVTNTIDENVVQVGEFVLGAMLCMAKNLFLWQDLKENSTQVWNSKGRDTMWTLNSKTFLQIGLGKVGTEITRRAREMGMKVIGVENERSFHRYCHKSYSLSDLSPVLPQADVICVALSKNKPHRNLLEKEELELIKKDAILIILGSGQMIDEEELIRLAPKFRGIFIDAFYQLPVPPSSPLWKIPNLIITPEVAPRPKAIEQMSFKTFLYNLRQYMHGNFQDMRNAIEKTAKVLEQ